MNRRQFFQRVAGAGVAIGALPFMAEAQDDIRPVTEWKEYGCAFEFNTDDLNDDLDFSRRAKYLQNAAQYTLDKHSLVALRDGQVTMTFKGRSQ